MSASDHLDDAQLLFERAQFHLRTFAGANNIGHRQLWNLENGTAPDGATHTADLFLDRGLLRAMKPVIADMANNLVHALDHVLAAARVQAGIERKEKITFRITIDDKLHEEHRKELRHYVGDEWTDLFSAAREQHRPFLPHLRTMKEISNDVKHWTLRPGLAGAHAIQWREPQHEIAEIPQGHFADHDRFRFWERSTAFPHVPVEIIMSFRIQGDDQAEVDLEAVASTSSNFVKDVIQRAANYLADHPAKTP